MQEAQVRRTAGPVFNGLAHIDPDSSFSTAVNGAETQEEQNRPAFPALIVAALTSGERARYDAQVGVKAPEDGLHHTPIALLNQIQTIDKRQVKRYWGRLSAETKQQVDEAIKLSLGLVPIQ